MLSPSPSATALLTRIGTKAVSAAAIMAILLRRDLRASPPCWQQEQLSPTRTHTGKDIGDDGAWQREARAASARCAGSGDAGGGVRGSPRLPTAFNCPAMTRP